MADFSVVNNLAALNAQRNLVNSNSGLSRTIGHLSSGLRINMAADDPAGLAISSKLRSDIRALNQAIRNGNDGISLVQTSEGSLEEINLILTRMKELSEEAASDTSGADDGASKEALQDEFTALRSEIDRIAQSTDFNGRTVLGDISMDIQVGIDSSSASRISVDTGGSLGSVTSSTLGVDSDDVSTKAGAQTALTNVNSAIDDIASLRGDLGALQSRLESTVRNISNVVENITAAESQIRDANIAQEVINLTKYQILNQTGIAALAQANFQAQSYLTLLR